MHNIITQLPQEFVLYADCEVVYSGRACSKLPRGNYLLIRKSDGSFLVHAGNKSTPRNYQGPKSKLYIDGNNIICKNKGETITVLVHNIINSYEIKDWCTNDIIMSNTEKDLVKKIIANWDTYLPAVNEKHTEYNTKAGPIDILGVGDEYHVIEVKRIKVSINHCVQLGKYLEAFSDDGKIAIGYMAAPSINARALEYCQKRNYKYIKVEFDD